MHPHQGCRKLEKDPTFQQRYEISIDQEITLPTLFELWTPPTSFLGEGCLLIDPMSIPWITSFPECYQCQDGRLHLNVIEEFTNIIHSLDPNIKVTTEEEQHGWLPFLDTCVIVNDDGTLRTTIYSKPTQTDQYLNWDTNHHLEHKRFVVRTLLRRAEAVFLIVPVVKGSDMWKY